MSDRGQPQRKRRTRSHVIEDLSENHLERQVLLEEHSLRRPARDYGVDVVMFHYTTDGEVENGEVRFQLKATEHIKRSQDQQAVLISIKTGDLHYWSLELFPFILVLYDVTSDLAYWLHVQQYVDENPHLLDPDRESVRVHIPTSNVLSTTAVKHFRKLSLDTVQSLRNQGGFRHE